MGIRRKDAEIIIKLIGICSDPIRLEFLEKNGGEIIKDLRINSENHSDMKMFMNGICKDMNDKARSIKTKKDH